MFIFTMQGQSTVSSTYATFELNIPKGKVKAWVQIPEKAKNSKLSNFIHFYYARSKYH